MIGLGSPDHYEADNRMQFCKNEKYPWIPTSGARQTLRTPGRYMGKCAGLFFGSCCRPLLYASFFWLRFWSGPGCLFCRVRLLPGFNHLVLNSLYRVHDGNVWISGWSWDERSHPFLEGYPGGYGCFAGIITPVIFWRRYVIKFFNFVWINQITFF